MGSRETHEQKRRNSRALSSIFECVAAEIHKIKAEYGFEMTSRSLSIDKTLKNLLSCNGMNMEKIGRDHISSEADSRQVNKRQIPAAHLAIKEEIPIKQGEQVQWHPYYYDEQGKKREINLADVTAIDPEIEFLDSAIIRYEVLTKRLQRLFDQQKAQVTPETVKEIQVLQDELAEMNGRIALGLKVLETKAAELKEERKFFMSREETYPEYSVTLEYINYQLKRLAYLQERGAQILSQEAEGKRGIDKGAIL